MELGCAQLVMGGHCEQGHGVVQGVAVLGGGRPGGRVWVGCRGMGLDTAPEHGVLDTAPDHRVL
jgi:hypothetical protein